MSQPPPWPPRPQQPWQSPNQWPPQQQWPPPPPKKSHTGLIVALSLSAVVLIGLVVTVAVVATPSRPTSNAATYGTLTTTQSPSSTRWSPSSTSRTTSSSPSSSSSTQPTYGGPHKILALADHPLMADPTMGLSNAPCAVPGWPSDPAASEAFFTAAADCLNARWSDLLSELGLPFHPPQLEFPTGSSFTTDCGTINVGVATAAYYCKDHLYVPWRGLQTDQYGNKPGVYLALFAHEYGHHVQDLVGIMDAAWNVIYQQGEDSPGGQEMSRRKELQAQCFSGMFMGATANRGGTITQKVFDTAWSDQDTRGDNTSGSHDHGTNAHYAAWWRKGAQSDRLAQCNTFSAPGSDVS
ncbi:metalloprotease [Amycolatopsis sp. K13G38]|uniref:Metalloprotease n=1 Tax=Amycolatopsis acididurans TaxID=2724524 RepID=A0ABX1JC80_9PSEU|nr:neutral zinc metallopeptidase [Amycolatopsis acididurans]NKQ57351.1 metalloprotease [Amycolatopsis acididurans]